MIPTAGFNVANSGPSSSGIELGDLTLQGQYRLAKFQEGRWIPTTSAVVQETFPTGKYDRLGDRPDGLGGGAYTTTLALYTQTYFWLPNRRILRMRFDASQAFSSNVNVEDVSVYGTTEGFPRARQAGQLVPRRFVLRIQCYAEMGAGARHHLPSQLEHTRDRI